MLSRLKVIITSLFPPHVPSFAEYQFTLHSGKLGIENHETSFTGWHYCNPDRPVKMRLRLLYSVIHELSCSRCGSKEEFYWWPGYSVYDWVIKGFRLQERLQFPMRFSALSGTCSGSWK